MHLVPAATTNGIRSILEEELNPRTLDDYLEALAQFPDDPARTPDGQLDTSRLPTEAIRVRKWGERRASPSRINPDQVRAFHRAYPCFIRVAYEIEDPWRAYTLESTAYMEHAGLRKMAAFMDAVWQSDERRHAAIFRAAYLALTGEEEIQPNPHQVDPVSAGAAALERHIYLRLIAELSAASTYAVFSSLARDDLEICTRNVAGDEFRHLAIFWAAIRWRYGAAVISRLARIMRHAMALGLLHRSNRTGLMRMGVEEAVFITKIGLTMAGCMQRLLAWDRRLTPGRLYEVYGPVPASRPLLVARAV